MKTAYGMPLICGPVYIGSRDDQPIAALLVFYFNGTAEYFTPVIKSEHRNTQALALVIYEAMKDAVSQKGCKNWNWGGTWLNQGGYTILRRDGGRVTIHTITTRNYLTKRLGPQAKTLCLRIIPVFSFFHLAN